MSIWIELMCDVRKPGADSSKLQPRCSTDRNENTMGRAGNTQADVRRVIRILEKEAKRNGWILTKGKWICPDCKGQKPK